MITLNTVGIDIDGTTYEMRKMSLGFQRRMLELQRNLTEKQKELAKKHGVSVDELEDKLTGEEQVEIATMSLNIQDVVAGLFVKPEEAAILDHFTEANITELIQALR